jgi:transcriptional regulator NrdR family protein
MTREVRACKVCGARFSATEEDEFCPVCVLRSALADVDCEESSSGETLGTAPVREAQIAKLRVKPHTDILPQPA